eukprot:scaffold77253_cov60-Phaeocystis_antarctica.AAC.5
MQARRHAGTQAGRQVSRSHLRAWLTHALLRTYQGGLPREELKQVYGLMSVRGLPCLRAYLLKPALSGLRALLTMALLTVAPLTVALELYILWQAFALLHQHAGDTRLPTHTSNQTAPPTDTLPLAGADAGASSNADEPEDEPEPAKRVVSAFATANASSVSSASVRVFLSYWGNPDAPRANESLGTRRVRVTLHHARGAAPVAAALAVVGPGTTDPRAAWDSRAKVAWPGLQAPMRPPTAPGPAHFLKIALWAREGRPRHLDAEEGLGGAPVPAPSRRGVTAFDPSGGRRWVRPQSPTPLSASPSNALPR